MNKKCNFDNWLEAQAVLEAWLYMLDKHANKKPRSWIDIMIDKATGYENQENEQLIVILEDILDAEKFLWMDTKKTEGLLSKLEELKSKHNK